jgi:hypothetical protein
MFLTSPAAPSCAGSFNADKVRPATALGRTMQVTKDAGEIRENYESGWLQMGRFIQPLIQSGKVDISRLLHILDQHNDAGPVLGPFQEGFAEQNKVPRDRDNVPLLQLYVVMGQYALLPRSIRDYMAVADMVASEVTADTEFVVELGSGWGRNLFRVYCRLEGKPVKFAACELTDTGRRVTEMVSALDRGMDCTTYAFDFNNPDLSFLEGKPNVVFFTNHSIEQIQDLSSTVFDLMLEKTGRCTCLHFEPVGWQRDGELRQLANGGPEAMSGHEYFIENDKLLRNAAAWSIKRGYNRNLLEVIQGLEQSGRIRTTQLIHDFLGGNPINPSTCIVWERA